MPLVEPHMNSFAAESQDDGGRHFKGGDQMEWLLIK